MAARLLKSIVCIGPVVGLAIWFAVEHHARLRLGEERQALETQSAQMAGLIAENERLSNLLARANPPSPLPDDQLRELLRLRGEVGLLREQSQDLETARAENQQARAALETGLKGPGAGATKAAATADYWPRDSWTFAGYASPDAALQSFVWAGSKGDLTNWLAGATGDVRKRMEQDLGGKSRDQAVIRAMDEFIGLKSVRVLNREVQADDTVVLTAAFEDRTQDHTAKLVMKKIDGEWKLSGPPE